MRVAVIAALLCIFFAGLGWVLRGAADYKHFETHLQEANALQAKIDTLQKTVIVARTSLAQTEKAALVAQVQHEKAIASLDVQHNKIVAELHSHSELPDTIKKLISDLVTNHETEKQVWMSENSLLRSELVAEQRLRATEELQFDSLSQVNADLRKAIAAKPNQVVLTKTGPWVATTMAFAATTAALLLVHK